MAVYGIDLGTTYSCIAKLDANSNPVIIENTDEGKDTLASALYFETEDNIIIGSAAKEYVETDGTQVIQFVKREIGKNASPHNMFGKDYTAVELSALILKRIKEYANAQGENVQDVVITVPAYFGNIERNLTKKAGEIAGLNVLDLINEPTAAALNYSNGLFAETKTILVYDLGGGTFDVTLVKLGTETDDNGHDITKVDIIATGGNDLLGGADWDQLLYEKLVNSVCDELGLQPTDLEVEARQTIRSKVESTKQKLSNAAKAKVRLSIDGQPLNIEVTKDEFEELTSSLVDQTMGYVEATLNQPRAQGVDIDVVLLVGGSTKMPMIQKAVKDKFGEDKVQIFDPDKAVAKGAAIYADILVRGGSVQPVDPDNIDITPTPIENPDDDTTQNGPSTAVNKPSIIMSDVASRTFGVGIYFRDENNNLVYLIDNLVQMGEEMGKVIEANYSTVAENQKLLIFKVFESLSHEQTEIPCLKPSDDGEGYVEQDTDPALAVKCLGELEIQLSGQDPRGTPVVVQFSAKNTGIDIQATISGITEKTVIKFDNGITDEQMEEMTQLINSMTVVAE